MRRVEIDGALICGGYGAKDPVEEYIVRIRRLCVGGLVSSASIDQDSENGGSQTH
jgi:hypothetical protein